MTGIIRDPTNDELQDFIPLETSVGKPKQAHEDFYEKLSEEMQKAVKKKLPFCDAKAKDDYFDSIDLEIKKQVREFGYLKNPIKLPKLDWNSYSDLKNFNLIEEGDESEPANKGHAPKLLHYKVYKFKGYSNIYTVYD